jgi:lipid A 3-O-deacylase
MRAGPWAGGEEVQNAVHRAIAVDTANGWSHQLDNEPGVVLTYEHKWRNIWKLAPGWLEFDLMPHVGAAAGNVFTYGAAGATLRIGADLPNDFGAPRIRPSLPGSTYFEPEDEFGLYVFVGGEGRYVLHNIFLDGNTFGPNRSHVDKNPLVGEWQFGAVMTVFDVRLAATYVVTTREFVGQEQPDQFGALTASFKF